MPHKLNQPGTENRTTFLFLNSSLALYGTGIPQALMLLVAGSYGMYMNFTPSGKESPTLRAVILLIENARKLPLYDFVLIWRSRGADVLSMFWRGLRAPARSRHLEVYNTLLGQKMAFKVSPPAIYLGVNTII
jgi:hypothetical protein